MSAPFRRQMSACRLRVLVDLRWRAAVEGHALLRVADGAVYGPFERLDEVAGGVDLVDDTSGRVGDEGVAVVEALDVAAVLGVDVGVVAEELGGDSGREIELVLEQKRRALARSVAEDEQVVRGEQMNAVLVGP